MKIISVQGLRIPDIKIIRFARFCDQRGYFTETYRKNDFMRHPEMTFMNGVEFRQCNESFSRKETIRGLHFQWNPYMGKLVRTLSGRMIDLFLDIRRNSPSLGKIMAYDMPANTNVDFNEWIWVPPGFAHGNFFPEDTLIEYFCSGEYSQGCEVGISPFAEDIDWSWCEPPLKELFNRIAGSAPLVTDKDKNGFLLNNWFKDERSKNFVYGQV